MDFLASSDEILSVGEFSRRFKMLVKTEVPELWLRGEISGLKTYSSGHTYFTLKDADASISAVLFKGYSRGVSFGLADGMKILAYGEVSVYEPRGTYQLLVKAAMPDGAGDLAKRFEALKQKLSNEGLFDKSKKRPIPRMPQNIGVITSLSGAAVRDFCRILKRRGWRGNVFVIPSKVQGIGAAEEIVERIKYAQTSPIGFDLLVLTRGGGSLEDLWCFNEEIVARAVAASEIPTISAVGHEIDFTLCDFAADLRMETPSGAAEFISSNFLDCKAQIENAAQTVRRALSMRIDALRASILRYADVIRLNSPRAKMAAAEIRIDELQMRAQAAVAALFARKRLRLSAAESALNASGTPHKLAVLKERVSAFEKRLESANIDSVLRRGFAIVRGADGKTASAQLLRSGDRVEITLRDGTKSAVVQ